MSPVNNNNADVGVLPVGIEGGLSRGEILKLWITFQDRAVNSIVKPLTGLSTLGISYPRKREGQMKQLPLWTVAGWSGRLEDSFGYYGIKIWLSMEFLKVSATVEYNEAAFHQRARDYLEMAGFSGGTARLAFWEYGLSDIQIPGSCCCLGITGESIDKVRRGDFEDGVYLEPHNIDTTKQQSALMSIWMLWAHSVHYKAGIHI